MKMNPQRLARLFKISRFLEAARARQFNDDKHVDAKGCIHLSPEEFGRVTRTFDDAASTIAKIDNFTPEEAEIIKFPAFAKNFGKFAECYRRIFAAYDGDDSDSFTRVEGVVVSWKTDKRCSTLPSEIKVDFNIGKSYRCFRFFDNFDKVECSDRQARVLEVFGSDEFASKFDAIVANAKEQFSHDFTGIL